MHGAGKLSGDASAVLIKAISRAARPYNLLGALDPGLQHAVVDLRYLLENSRMNGSLSGVPIPALRRVVEVASRDPSQDLSGVKKWLDSLR
jgi:hypothetical protein